MAKFSCSASHPDPSATPTGRLTCRNEDQEWSGWGWTALGQKQRPGSPAASLQPQPWRKVGAGHRADLVFIGWMSLSGAAISSES